MVVQLLRLIKFLVQFEFISLIEDFQLRLGKSKMLLDFQRFKLNDYTLFNIKMTLIVIMMIQVIINQFTQQFINTYKRFQTMRVKIIPLLMAFLVIFSSFSVVAQQQKYQFVAEVGRLMDIIINSLYTQKEIFLRQLISNASDALDKIRFLSITDPNILGSQTELQIKVQFDQEQHILEIVDNGIGMTKNQLITNLGTVAKSGTTNFLEGLKSGQINLIGQFGVGFYSSFLVASKVQVISKHNDDAQYKWISSASNSFTVEEDHSVQLKRGTLVRLYLKEDSTQYSTYEQLQKLIQRYSSFINYPIYLRKKNFYEENVEKSEEELQKQYEELKTKWKEEGKQFTDEDIENSVNRTTTKQAWNYKFERLNENKPLWLKNKNQVQKTEYKDFYKNVFKDSSDPLTWSHFKAEGDVDFTGLMYIPERAPYDQFEKFHEKKNQVKLFVRRVLVNDKFEDLLPKYLNFIKAIVDSDNLPLNVDRQNIQQVQILKKIGQKLLSKSVQMLVSFNPEPQDEEDMFQDQKEEDEEENIGFSSAYEKKVDTFNKFWKNFGKNIKLGMIEDVQNREKLAVITRWYTTNNVSQLSSLDEYIGRMKQGQKNIYFLGGQNKQSLKHSPLIQKLVQEGYEVILGEDPLDQTIFHHFRQYKKYKIVNVARNDFKEPYKNDDLRKEVKYLTKMYQPLIDYAQKQLREYIKSVKISTRLVDQPVVIVTDMMNDTPNRQRIDAASSMRSQLKYTKEKNVLQINPHAPVIQELNKIVEQQPDENSAKLIKNLYYAALIHSGYIVKDPLYFSQNVFDLINTALGVKTPIEEIQVTEEDLLTLQAAPEAKQVQEQAKKTDEVINLDDEQQVQVNTESNSESVENAAQQSREEQSEDETSNENPEQMEL